MSDSVTAEVLDGGVGLLTFDQPDSRANVLSSAMWAELDAGIDNLVGRGVTGLLLGSAKESIFIAGADLKELYAGMAGDPDGCRRLIEAGHRALNKLESLPLPTAALIDGACLGGGLEMALACDYRLAGTGPKFQVGLPEVKLGLIPGWGGTQRLPRLIGAEAALRMIQTGESLSAEEALAAGVVDVVVDSTELVEAGRQWLAPGKPERETAPEEGPDLPGEGVAADLIRRGAGLPLAEALALEQEAFLALTATPEAAERVRAFLERRR